MVTIADVAKRAGVAKSTVSNVLSKKKYVSPDLQEIVLKAIEELNFQPNFFAASITRSRTNILGLFLEQNDEKNYQSFYNDLIKACITVCSEIDYNVLIYYGLKEKNLATLLQQGKSPIDSAIVLSPCMYDERLYQINSNRIPCVIIGRPNFDDHDMSYVDVDNAGLVYNLTKQIANSNHKKICFINSASNLTISADRSNGFNKAVEEFGLKDCSVYYSEKSTISEGFDISFKCIKEKPETTLFITANDLLAKGVYDMAAKKGLVVGQDISVCALGGEVYIGNTLTPKLSYAHQDYSLMINEAIKILMCEMADKETPKTQKFIESELCLTDSVKL